jgi:serine protease Do
MKRLFVLLWALLSVLAATPSWADVDRAVLIGLSASVLKIEALRVQGGFSLGSGVVVAPERIITNCHVTRDAPKVNVLRGGVRWIAEAQRSDIDHDLCLLRVPGLQARAVALGRSDQLKPGQAVRALGYTGGLGLQNSPGEVLALHGFDGSHVIRSSNWFNSGASGGGLFDDEQRLVGILTFRLRGGEAHYFAAPAEWLVPLLETPGEVGYTDVAPQRSQQVAFWQRPFVDQPRFLRATLLQRDDQWRELESLAVEWAREDAGDPEPWYLMGVALARMDRLPEAQRALDCSLAAGSAAGVSGAGLALPKSMDRLPESALARAPCVIGATSSRTP